MRTFVIMTAFIGTIGLAAPASAAVGQCYDAYGRPVGPTYDTDHPNYGFLNSVIRRGGSCTGVSSNWQRNRGQRFDRFYYRSPDSYRYRDRRYRYYRY